MKATNNQRQRYTGVLSIQKEHDVMTTQLSHPQKYKTTLPYPTTYLIS